MIAVISDPEVRRADIIRALLGHRKVLRVTASGTDRARISEVIAESPLEHRMASKSARSDHRSARLRARQCEGIVMPSRCPIDAQLVLTPGTSVTVEVTL